MTKAGQSNEREVSKKSPEKAITPKELVRRYSSAVLGLCIAHTKNFHDSEDIMQNVFVKAISKLDTLRDANRARAWLMQIARRECIDYHRRKEVSRPVSVDIQAPASENNQQIENLHKAISRLPENYREPITLFYLNGQNCPSVAKTLGISEDAVRSRLVRARLQLHEILSEDLL